MTKVYPNSDAPTLEDYKAAESSVCPDVCHRVYTDNERAEIVGTAWRMFHARKTKQ